jgi:hypothetical protein
MNAILSRPVFRQVALVVAAVATLAAMPAFAESPTVNTEIDSAVSTKSRAEVRAELEQARRDGSMRVWSDSYNPALAARSLKTRAEVRAELEASRHLLSLTAEDGGSFAMVMPQHHGASIRVAQR